MMTNPITTHEKVTRQASLSIMCSSSNTNTFLTTWENPLVKECLARLDNTGEWWEWCEDHHIFKSHFTEIELIKLRRYLWGSGGHLFKGTSPEEQEARVALALLILESPQPAYNYRERGGGGLLHVLAGVYSHRIVRLGVAVCGDMALSSVDNRGHSPIHIATRRGGVGVIKALLTPLTLTELQLPFMTGRELTHTPPPSLTERNKDGDSPVHIACIGGRDDCLELLLAHAPESLNLRNGHRGFTIGHCAIWWDRNNSHTKCLDIYLRAGGSTRIKCHRGRDLFGLSESLCRADINLRLNSS